MVNRRQTVSEEDLEKVRTGQVKALGEKLAKKDLHQDPFANDELEMETKERLAFKE